VRGRIRKGVIEREEWRVKLPAIWYPFKFKWALPTGIILLYLEKRILK